MSFSKFSTDFKTSEKPYDFDMSPDQKYDKAKKVLDFADKTSKNDEFEDIYKTPKKIKKIDDKIA